MDTKGRTLAKTLTWQTCGLLMMAILGYVTTGSLTAAGGLAVASTVFGTISYILHERLWARIGWGRVPLTSRPPSRDV